MRAIAYVPPGYSAACDYRTHARRRARTACAPVSVLAIDAATRVRELAVPELHRITSAWSHADWAEKVASHYAAVNVHKKSAAVALEALEAFRLAPLLSSGVRVVSERADAEDMREYEGLVEFADDAPRVGARARELARECESTDAAAQRDVADRIAREFQHRFNTTERLRVALAESWVDDFDEIAATFVHENHDVSNGARCTNDLSCVAERIAHRLRDEAPARTTSPDQAQEGGVLWHRFTKVGGTALRNALVARGATVADLDPLLENAGGALGAPASAVARAARDALGSARVISGDAFWLPDDAFWPAKPPLRVVVLREPVTRCASRVSYSLRDRLGLGASDWARGHFGDSHLHWRDPATGATRAVRSLDELALAGALDGTRTPLRFGFQQGANVSLWDHAPAERMWEYVRANCNDYYARALCGPADDAACAPVLPAQPAAVEQGGDTRDATVAVAAAAALEHDAARLARARAPRERGRRRRDGGARGDRARARRHAAWRACGLARRARARASRRRTAPRMQPNDPRRVRKRCGARESPAAIRSLRCWRRCACRASQQA